MQKRLELISELVPRADPVGLLVNPNNPGVERIIIIETFAASCQPKHRPAPATAAVSIDTS